MATALVEKPFATLVLGEAAESASPWRFMHAGTHARIAAILDTDTEVGNNLNTACGPTGNAQARRRSIEMIVHRTGNLIGIAILRQMGQNVEPRSTDEQFTVWKALKPGDEEMVTETIDGDPLVHSYFATGDKPSVVRLISRFTGRAVGQLAIRDTGALIDLVKTLLEMKKGPLGI